MLAVLAPASSWSSDSSSNGGLSVESCKWAGHHARKRDVQGLRCMPETGLEIRFRYGRPITNLLLLFAHFREVRVESSLHVVGYFKPFFQPQLPV